MTYYVSIHADQNVLSKVNFASKELVNHHGVDRFRSSRRDLELCLLSTQLFLQSLYISKFSFEIRVFPSCQLLQICPDPQRYHQTIIDEVQALVTMAQRNFQNQFFRSTRYVMGQAQSALEPRHGS